MEAIFFVPATRMRAKVELAASRAVHNHHSRALGSGNRTEANKPGAMSKPFILKRFHDNLSSRQIDMKQDSPKADPSFNLLPFSDSVLLCSIWLRVWTSSKMIRPLLALGSQTKNG